MSYFVEILEWFSRHSKRNLRVFEATLLEVDETQGQQQSPQQEHPEYQKAIQWGQKIKGRNVALNDPYPAQNGNRIPIYTTGKGLIAFEYGSLTYNSQHPKFKEKLTKLLSQKQETGDQQSKPEEGDPGDEDQPSAEQESAFAQSARKNITEYFDGLNSDGKVKSRLKRIVQKFKEFYSDSKNRTSTTSPHRQLIEQDESTILDRILGSGRHSLMRLILNSVVQRLTPDGKRVDATDVERSQMLDFVMGHLTKIIKKRNMTPSDRQKFLDSVKIVKTPDSSGRYRLIIYSEDKSLALSLPYSGVSELVFEDLSIEKINDSLPEGVEKITGGLEKISYSNAYSGVFGNILEQLSVTQVLWKNALEDMKTCKDKKLIESLEKRCKNLKSKIDSLEADLAIHAANLTRNVKLLGQLAIEQKGLLGDAEHVEGLSQAIAELSPILGNQYAEELKMFQKLPEEERTKRTKELFSNLCNNVASVVLRYSSQFNVALNNADHAIGVGGKVKGGGRRQDVRYFYTDEGKAKTSSEFLESKVQEFDLNNPSDLQNLRTNYFSGDEESLDYLVDKAREASKDGKPKIYLLESSIKNSLDKNGSTKMATISSEHHSLETNSMISVLDKGFDHPDSVKAMQDYNDFLVNVLNATPLTRKEFEDRVSSVRTRLGGLFTPDGKTMDQKTLDKKISKALKKSKERSDKLIEIGRDSGEKLTKTLSGKKTKAQKLIAVAGILKQACSELGIGSSKEVGSSLDKITTGSEEEFEKSIRDEPTQRQEEYRRLRNILNDIDNEQGFEEDPNYGTQCVQKALSFLMNESAARKIEKGDMEEAEILAASMFSKFGVSIDDLSISHHNYGSRTVGIVSHNGILEHFGKAIIGIADTKGSNNNHRIFVTADGIRIETANEANRLDPKAESESPSIVLSTKFTGHSASGGQSVATANKATLNVLSHQRKVFEEQGSESSRSKNQR